MALAEAVASSVSLCQNVFVMGHQLRFGRFRFDPEAGRLWAGEQEVRLTPKAAAVMSMLVGHAGEPVTKEDLFASVWPDTAVSDDALTTCIAELRRALEDDARQPRFIETRHRRGYLFVAPLSPVEEDTAPTFRSGTGTDTGQVAVVDSPPPAGQVSLPRAAARTQPRQRRAAWIGGLLAGVAVAALLVAFAPRLRRGAGGVEHAPIRSLAVLPLANLTGDPGQEYFSDGMTDALITNLASLPELHVISRQSVMRYKGSAKPLAEIARELGVEGVVEGSVMRSGGRVRITAQLLHAATDRHLWVHSYERRLEDVLALQGELARAVAEQVRITIGTKETRRLTPERTVKPEAYDAYLLGRHHWNQRSEEGLERALSYFRVAIGADPDFALAHAGLAVAYAPRLVMGYVPPGRGLAEQKAAALKALELDPGLGEARAALASVHAQEWDWQGAEAEFRRAVESDPSSTVGHLWHAWYLSALGRVEEGLGERRRALELDPLDLTVNQGLAGTLFVAGREEAALAQWSRVLELEPEHARSRVQVALIHFRRRRTDEGLEQLERARSHEANDPLTLTGLGVAYVAVGNGQEARRVLARLEAESGRHYVSPVLRAYVHAALDERDKAFALLEEAYAARDPLLIPIQVGTVGAYCFMSDAGSAALRSDPRFADLLRRMGLLPELKHRPILPTDKGQEVPRSEVGRRSRLAKLADRGELRTRGRRPKPTPWPTTLQPADRDLGNRQLQPRSRNALQGASVPPEIETPSLRN